MQQIISHMNLFSCFQIISSLAIEINGMISSINQFMEKKINNPKNERKIAFAKTRY